MAESLNALTDAQVARIGQMLNWFEANGGHDPQPERRRFDGTVEFKFGKPSSDISADASGAITEWTLTGSTFVASTDSETAFDWFGTGAQSTDKVAFWRHQASGEHVFAVIANPFGMAWEGYLPSDVIVSSTDYSTVVFSQLKNNTTDVYGTTDAAAGYDLIIKKDGLFKFTQTEQLVVASSTQSVFVISADIIIEDDSAAEVPKSGINQTWYPLSEVGPITLTRSLIVNNAEDTSYRVRAKRGGLSDDYTLNGGSSTEAQGGNWTVTYEGATP